MYLIFISAKMPMAFKLLSLDSFIYANTLKKSNCYIRIVIIYNYTLKMDIIFV